MKHRKPLFILLIAVLAMQIILMSASAEYTGPNSGARRYSYEVEVPGTCSEEYSCCTRWSNEPCASNPWKIGCCTSYGTCSREYTGVWKQRVVVLANLLQIDIGYNQPEITVPVSK